MIHCMDQVLLNFNKTNKSKQFITQFTHHTIHISQHLEQRKHTCKHLEWIFAPVLVWVQWKASSLDVHKPIHWSHECNPYNEECCTCHLKDLINNKSKKVYHTMILYQIYKEFTYTTIYNDYYDWLLTGYQLVISHKHNCEARQEWLLCYFKHLKWYETLCTMLQRLTVTGQKWQGAQQA